MADVINFPGGTAYLDLDPQEMVKNAMSEYAFDKVMLIGWTGTGDERDFTVCSSMGQTAEMIHSLELAKKAILDASEY